MTNPLVTIVIIAYNEEKHIAEAIESALAQTYPNLEIILVDDGSSDKTLTIARSYEPRIKVISQENSGNCSSPRNTGIRSSKGTFISFLDGDDILCNDKISKQAMLFKKFSGAASVVGNFRNFGDTPAPKDHFSTCPIISSLFNSKNINHFEFKPGEATTILPQENFANAVSPLFKTEKIRLLGGFSEDLFSCEDFHLNYRMASQWPMVVTKDIVFLRRMHGTNMSSNNLKMSKYYFISRSMLKSYETNFMQKKLLTSEVRKRYKSYLKETLINRSAI